MAFNIDSILGKSRQSGLEERNTPERSFVNSGKFTNPFVTEILFLSLNNVK